MLPNEIIFVSGQRGSGKSYWVKNFIKTLPRCFIYDSLGEYEGDQRFLNCDAIIDFLIQDELKPQFFTAIFDPYNHEDFPYFCRIMLARGDMYVVIEEIDLFTSPLNTPPELMKLIKYGRHYGIQIIGISRRPAEVSRQFTAQSTRFVIFGQREPRDLQYFRSVIGTQADQIPALDIGHHLDVDFKNPSYIANKPV